MTRNDDQSDDNAIPFTWLLYINKFISVRYTFKSMLLSSVCFFLCLTTPLEILFYHLKIDTFWCINTCDGINYTFVKWNKGIILIFVYYTWKKNNKCLLIMSTYISLLFYIVIVVMICMFFYYFLYVSF